ncbi:MAG: FkbM family methyltransferase [Acidobacteriota bacterium]
MYLLSFVRRLFRIPATFIYAQGAEDFIAGHYLRHLFNVERGTYVDVGCNRPLRNSNTFDFYKLGWRGIAIDANMDLIAEFQAVRKQDICVTSAVSDEQRDAFFYKSDEDLVSTIDEDRLIEWKKHWEFNEGEKVVTRTLTSILDDYSLVDIDLLSIDVEGHDLQVLRGLDLTKYRPKLIIIEIHDLANVEGSPIYVYLTEHGYELKAFAILSAFFVRRG